MDRNSDNKNVGWKYVLIGEVPGVMMGVAGTVAAAQYAMAHGTFVRGQENALEVPVARIDDRMSFSEAVASARAQVGDGGVFQWRGDVYNTFYKEEWDNMTDKQRADFVERYQNTEIPELVSPDGGNGRYDDSSEDVDDGDEDVEFEEVEFEEVEVLSVDNVEFEDGTMGTVASIEINGVSGALVDIDGDGIADYVAIDVNGDGDLSEDEVFCCDGQRISMPTALISDCFIGGVDDDLPDYMNDNDTSAFA